MTVAPLRAPEEELQAMRVPTVGLGLLAALSVGGAAPEAAGEPRGPVTIIYTIDIGTALATCG
jgi:hypothetical protein